MREDSLRLKVYNINHLYILIEVLSVMDVYLILSIYIGLQVNLTLIFYFLTVSKNTLHN